jgi:hypothetical protein
VNCVKLSAERSEAGPQYPANLHERGTNSPAEAKRRRAAYFLGQIIAYSGTKPCPTAAKRRRMARLYLITTIEAWSHMSYSGRLRAALALQCLLSQEAVDHLESNSRLVHGGHVASVEHAQEREQAGVRPNEAGVRGVDDERVGLGMGELLLVRPLHRFRPCQACDDAGRVIGLLICPSLLSVGAIGAEYTWEAKGQRLK